MDIATSKNKIVEVLRMQGKFQLGTGIRESKPNTLLHWQ